MSQRDQVLVKGVVGVEVPVEVDEAVADEQRRHGVEAPAQLGDLNVRHTGHRQ